jgi:hypothetical protein
LIPKDKKVVPTKQPVAPEPKKTTAVPVKKPEEEDSTNIKKVALIEVAQIRKWMGLQAKDQRNSICARIHRAGT